METREKEDHLFSRQHRGGEVLKWRRQHLYIFLFSPSTKCAVWGNKRIQKTKPSFIIPKSIKRDEALINADEKWK